MKKAKLEEGLKKVSEKLIAETKKENSYLIIADEEGNKKRRTQRTVAITKNCKNFNKR